jgi:pantothenate kinase
MYVSGKLNWLTDSLESRLADGSHAYDSEGVGTDVSQDNSPRTTRTLQSVRDRRDSASEGDEFADLNESPDSSVLRRRLRVATDHSADDDDAKETPDMPPTLMADPPPMPATLPRIRSWHEIAKDSVNAVLSTEEERTDLSEGERPRRPQLSPTDRPCIGLDIGGTLVKLVLFEPKQADGSRKEKWRRIAGSFPDGLRNFKPLRDLTFEVDAGRFYFACMETSGLRRLITCAEEPLTRVWAEIFGRGKDSRVVATTGGGAHKYRYFANEKLNIDIQPVDELKTVLKGILWSLQSVSDQLYCLKHVNFSEAVRAERQYIATKIDGTRSYVLSPESEPRPLFPFILVNIGTGVSIVLVKSEEEMQRIGGTSIGGGEPDAVR